MNVQANRTGQIKVNANVTKCKY